jgi:hypothetical protein
MANLIEYEACSLSSEIDILKLYPLLSEISIDKLLNMDLYVTFRRTLAVKEGKVPVIIKFFIKISDPNNEYTVLQFLKEHSNCKHLFPKPYLSVDFKEEVKLNVNFYRIIDAKSEFITKVIIYEYNSEE